MSDQPNRAAGVVTSFETVDPSDDPDWPLTRIKGLIKDDLDGRIYIYNHKTFEGWYDARPLVGKRVRFLRYYSGQHGHVAEEVELE
ncbi:hypothetical protein T3H00_18135 [Pseudomonas fluorescens]|jgi:hypothetical protein|uniref:hypothetical protein n=1 Tax=Pseudomonas TaxID=286 RepID=UPI001A92F103|nr:MULTISPECIES: hypothetical protein [Pseudomonas]MDZ5434578.1 hypothetical protein [Pseudomonas fluorescens]